MIAHSKLMKYLQCITVVEVKNGQIVGGRESISSEKKTIDQLRLWLRYSGDINIFV